MIAIVSGAFSFSPAAAVAAGKLGRGEDGQPVTLPLGQAHGVMLVGRATSIEYGRMQPRCKPIGPNGSVPLAARNVHHGSDHKEGRA